MLSSLDVVDEITQPGYDLLWLQTSSLMSVLPLWDLPALLCGAKKGGHPLETASHFGNCLLFFLPSLQNCCPSTMVKMWPQGRKDLPLSHETRFALVVDYSPPCKNSQKNLFWTMEFSFSVQDFQPLILAGIGEIGKRGETIN